MISRSAIFLALLFFANFVGAMENFRPIGAEEVDYFMIDALLDLVDRVQVNLDDDTLNKIETLNSSRTTAAYMSVIDALDNNQEFKDAVVAKRRRLNCIRAGGAACIFFSSLILYFSLRSQILLLGISAYALGFGMLMPHISPKERHDQFKGTLLLLFGLYQMFQATGNYYWDNQGCK